MNPPGFTANLALSRSARAIALCSCRHTSSLSRMAQRFDRGGTIRPAARDEAQQEYADCLQECRREGGDNCVDECLKATYPSPGYGEGKGTSDAQVACCAGMLAACLITVGPSAFIGQWGIAVGISLCLFQSMFCTQNAPCSRL
jgi:hypothetical protein